MAQILFASIFGFGLFLFGMKMMELSLHRWAGPRLLGMLETYTATPWHGLVAGTGITALLQSSTAVTVLSIGLVNAGLLTFPRTLGIILGTNIGTCLTTELIGLNINRLGLPLLILSICTLAVSFVMIQQKDGTAQVASFRLSVGALRSTQWLSLAIAGFSCVLLGIHTMQSVAPALQERGLFDWFVEQAQRSLLWGIAAGAIVTAIIHSSAAVIAMAMGLASSGVLPPELGIAIVIGANVGTCATAFIASIGGSKAGQLVAWSHIALNVGGAILFYPLIPVLHDFVNWMTNQPSGQIARAQTVFNIACSLLSLPLCYLPVWRKFRPQS